MSFPLILYPQSKKNVSVEEVLAGADSHLYGLDIQNFSVPQHLFSEPVREEAMQQRRLCMVIYQINKAKYSCWKKCSTGQIVTHRFTANSDAIMCAVEVSGL